MHNSQSHLDDYNDLKNRFAIEKSISTLSETRDEDNLYEERALSNFDIHENDEIEDMKYSEKAIKYKDVEEAIKQEQKFTKEAMER